MRVPFPDARANEQKIKKKGERERVASPGEILGRSSTALCFVLREIATSPVGRANQLEIYDRGWPGCSCIRSLSHGIPRSHGWLKTE